MRDPHPWLPTVADAPHGGDAPAGLLDLSASLAPLGPSPRAVAAARHADVAAYPARGGGELVPAAARLLGVHPGRVAVAAGASELLLRAVQAHLSPGDRVLCVAPCFGEYARAARAAGGTPVMWRGPRGDGAVRDEDVAALAAEAERTGAAVGVLARPASPTGVLGSVAATAALVARTPAVTWIVDEAFIGLTDGAGSVAGGDAVTVRSLTKELALAGLRVAVADAPETAAAGLRALLPPWPLGAPAIAGAVAGLADGSHRAAVGAAVRHGRERLLAVLAEAGLRPWPSVTSYVCAAVPGAPEVAAALRGRGIAVRLCDDLGLPGALRIAVPPPSEQDRLEEALRSVLAAAPVS